MQFNYHNFLDEASSLLPKLQNDLSYCEKSLKSLPKGALYTLNQNGKTIYYQRIGKKRTHLSKEKSSLRKSLAKKAYLKNFKRYAENEIDALSAYLKKKKNISSPSEYLVNHPVIRQLISENFFNGPSDIIAWAKMPYDQSNFHPEGLTICSANGHFVRSKSECIIADALLAAKVPYRYEEPLEINGIIYRPDFTFYNKRGKIIIWEHLGRLDDSVYFKNNLNKIANLIKAGFRPGINLILTADGDDGHTINSFIVHSLIEAYIK